MPNGQSPDSEDQQRQDPNSNAMLLRQQRLLMQSLQTSGADIGGTRSQRRPGDFAGSIRPSLSNLPSDHGYSVQEGAGFMQTLGGGDSAAISAARRESQQRGEWAQHHLSLLQQQLEHGQGGVDIPTSLISGSGASPAYLASPRPFSDINRLGQKSSSDSDHSTPPVDSNALARLLYPSIAPGPPQSGPLQPQTIAPLGYGGAIDIATAPPGGATSPAASAAAGLPSAQENLFRLYNSQARHLANQLQLQQQSLESQLNPMHSPLAPLHQGLTAGLHGSLGSGSNQPFSHGQAAHGMLQQSALLHTHRARVEHQIASQGGPHGRFSRHQDPASNFGGFPDRALAQQRPPQHGLFSSSMSHGGDRGPDSRKRGFLEMKMGNPMALNTLLEAKKEAPKPKRRKKRRPQRKKPPDMPRRPLSAYNVFFSEERERILAELDGREVSAALPTDFGEDDQKPAAAETGEKKPAIQALLRPLIPSEKKRRPHRKTHGKIAFKELAQLVGSRWKALSDERRRYYQNLADQDLVRHKKAMEDYYKRQAETKAAPKDEGEQGGEAGEDEEGKDAKGADSGDGEAGS